jgi:hypothetical protein
MKERERIRIPRGTWRIIAESEMYGSSQYHDSANLSPPGLSAFAAVCQGQLIRSKPTRNGALSHQWDLPNLPPVQRNGKFALLLNAAFLARLQPSVCATSRRAAARTACGARLDRLLQPGRSGRTAFTASTHSWCLVRERARESCEGGEGL